MNLLRLFHTILYLRPTQIFFQLRKFVVKPKYAHTSAPAHNMLSMMTEPIARYKGVEKNVFSFLNLKHEFAGWNFTDNGMLWAYNQNYFDWINQEGFTKEEACQWIDRYLAELHENRVGMDPYPIALRGINWIKFFCRHPDCATKEREDSLYSQYRLLERKLEYHLLGNHLLEDAYSLTIGGYYFDDEHMKQKGMKLLLRELQEQILPDGAHYEQSPMYHCILLDRLLDTYNITRRAELIPYAQRMLGHLESICYEDNAWPFFGDAASGIAPTPQEIKDYAHRLGISWEALPLNECGYRKMQSERMEAFVDVGNIMATYQPGHSHADTLTFELRIDGKPFIVDTGISTYEKNARRQYERGTAAHNTVTSMNRDSSEVWGGFRVGKLCKVMCTKDDKQCIEAEHNGFDHVHKRRFSINDSQFAITDCCKAKECVAHLHFAPDIEDIYIDNHIIHTTIADIVVKGNVTSISLTDCEVSTEYYLMQKSEKALIAFEEECVVTIEPKPNKKKA